MATFADETVIVTVEKSVETSTKKLQTALTKVGIWTHQLYESKSTQYHFTNKGIIQ